MTIVSNFVPEDDTGSWHYDEGARADPPRWLVKGILPETGSGILSGQWGTYKTTVALDLCVSVMSAIPFAGRYRIKRPGAALYLAVEGAGMLLHRLKTIAAQQNVHDPLPFAWRSDCPPLVAKDAAEILSAQVQQAAAELERRFHLPTVLIWVDTVITAAGYAATGDDNDAAAAQKIMNTLAHLSRQIGAFVCGIDHFGKVMETGTRGSSAKEGAADTILATLADREVNGSVKNTRLAVRKQRGGVQGFEIPFAAQVIETGRDEDDDAITAVVIDWQAPQDMKQQADARWAPSLQLLRRIMMTALTDIGRDIRPFIDGPTVRACDVEIVRAEFYRQHPADGTEKQKREARRKTFQRAFKDAQARSLIASREVDGVQFVWLAKPEP